MRERFTPLLEMEEAEVEEDIEKEIKLSTCPLAFGCWPLDHVICLKLRKLRKVTKLQLFLLKRQPRTILSENSHFVNLLSLRLIT